ncbi:MAG TPA: hypothetical protein VF050_09140, partial [Moraxellaceae bacterium]
AHDGIATDPAPLVSFTACSASSLDFTVTAFTKTTDGTEFAQVKQDVLLRIMAIIAEAEAEFAFPTQTLHVASAPDSAAQTATS